VFSRRKGVPDADYFIEKHKLENKILDWLNTSKDHVLHWESPTMIHTAETNPDEPKRIYNKTEVKQRLAQLRRNSGHEQDNLLSTRYLLQQNYQPKQDVTKNASLLTLQATSEET
ncbi:unnamed protein product, partial [Didymodactylos carnosus]